MPTRVSARWYAFHDLGCRVQVMPHRRLDVLGGGAPSICLLFLRTTVKASGQQSGFCPLMAAAGIQPPFNCSRSDNDSITADGLYSLMRLYINVFTSVYRLGHPHVASSPSRPAPIKCNE